MGSPGPTNLSAAAVGAAFGARRAAPYVTGLALGTMVVLVLVIAGFASLASAFPAAALVLKIFGVLYILYLALQIATARPIEASEAAAPSFTGGVLLGVANPKAFFSIAAVVAGVALVPDDPVADGLAKAAMLSVLIALIQAGWLCLGVVLSSLLQSPRSARMVNGTMAVILVASAIMSVLQ
jgi:threonine/homoserine/homoserine lactone efflux protein